MPTTPEKLKKAQKAFEDTRKGRVWTLRNKLLAVLALLYVISPVDLVPDWLFPLVGWLDDLGVVGLVALWIRHSVAQQQEQALPAEQEQEKNPSAPKD